MPAASATAKLPISPAAKSKSLKPPANRVPAPSRAKSVERVERVEIVERSEPAEQAESAASPFPAGIPEALHAEQAALAALQERLLEKARQRGGWRAIACGLLVMLVIFAIGAIAALCTISRPLDKTPGEGRNLLGAGFLLVGGFAIVLSEAIPFWRAALAGAALAAVLFLLWMESKKLHDEKPSS